MEDWRELNRANWDERVAVHLGPGGYDPGFDARGFAPLSKSNAPLWRDRDAAEPRGQPVRPHPGTYRVVAAGRPTCRSWGACSMLQRCLS